jgi:hypothetical protein
MSSSTRSYAIRYSFPHHFPRQRKQYRLGRILISRRARYRSRQGGTSLKPQPRSP